MLHPVDEPVEKQHVMYSIMNTPNQTIAGDRTTYYGVQVKFSYYLGKRQGGLETFSGRYVVLFTSQCNF